MKMSLKRAFQKRMTRGGSPKGRPKIQNLLLVGAIYSCIPISRTSIASPFSYDFVPYLSPLPLHPDPPLPQGGE